MLKTENNLYPFKIKGLTPITLSVFTKISRLPATFSLQYIKSVKSGKIDYLVE